MEEDSKTSNNNQPGKTASVNNPPKKSSKSKLRGLNRLTPRQKLEKGNKTLAYMLGRSSGIKLYKIVREEDLFCRQVRGVPLDVAAVQDFNNQNNNVKSRLKTTIIAVLGILLAISLLYLTISVAGYSRDIRHPNCKYYIESDVSAHWIIDDSTETEFTICEGLTNGSIYKLKSALIIDSLDKVNIKITITATVNGEQIYISGLYNAADNMKRIGNENTWVYVDGYEGGGEVCLFEGIDFSASHKGLTSQNINIIVSAEITKG